MKSLNNLVLGFSRLLARRRRATCRFMVALSVFVSGLHMSMAGSATWKLDPTSNDWNTAANWTPENVPDQVTDVATFGISHVTGISVAAYDPLDSIVFSPDASAYTITVSENNPLGYLEILGGGVANNSGMTQNFYCYGNIYFGGSATAGKDVIYTSQDTGDPFYYTLGFGDTANAGSATFIDPGETSTSLSASVVFFDHSTAANSTIINEASDTIGGGAAFYDSSTAGNSTITTYNNGNLVFFDTATGANATLIEDGARLRFEYQSTGGLARVELLHEGLLDLTSRNKSGPMSIGSLEGDSSGLVMLGTVKVQQLTIGGNGLNTTFEGSIQGGTTGSLLKTGPESLTLSGVNTYTGGTVVEGGTLLVANTKGSGTGTGPVQVNAGTFGGRSNITGAVTIGSGSGPGAVLAPGINGPGVLSIHNTLTFQGDGSYDWEVNLAKGQGDEVICKGATIASGAQFTIEPRGNQTLAAGTVFTVLENKTRQPISGTFANLPEGAIVSVGGNQLQASYRGGDGNDLTLTVLP